MSYSLCAQPSIVLEGQVLEAHTTLVLLHVYDELIYGIPWRLQLEHQSTNLIIEETGNCFDFHAVAIINTYLIQVAVCLEVVSASKGKD